MTRLDDIREHLGVDYPSVRELCDHAQALADACRKYAWTIESHDRVYRPSGAADALAAFDEWNADQ